MIFITGDTHIPFDVSKLNNNNFKEQIKLTKEDYVIISGDFGLIFKNDKTFEWWLKWFNEKKFTTLFVDGNHENFNWLYQFPIIEKFGGQVGKISNSIYHLRRGEIYEIEGKKIFTFGGADSIDKHERAEHISWWKEEMPNYAEMNYGLDMLESVNYQVDIVITHTCPSSIGSQMVSDKITSHLEHYFDEIKNLLDEKKVRYQWYFGHYHKDIDFDNIHAVFNRIIKI